MNLISREEESNQNSRLVSGELVEAFEDWIQIDRNNLLFNDLMAGFNHKILQTDRELLHLKMRASGSEL